VAASTNRPVVEALRHSMRAKPDLLGIVEVRLALEVEAASLAAERRTEEDVSALRDAADRMAVLRYTPGVGGFVQADVAFHEAVVRATHNPVFAMVAESISELLQETRVAIAESGRSPRTLAEATTTQPDVTAAGRVGKSAPAGDEAQLGNLTSAEAHAHILERIVARDSEGAAAAMRWHLSRVRDNLAAVVKQRYVRQLAQEEERWIAGLAETC
jgi:DNA-binding FadR family transcriptional regulator